MRSTCRQAEFAADFNREQEGTVKSQRPTGSDAVWKSRFKRQRRSL